MRGSRTPRDPMRFLAFLAVLTVAAGCGFVHKIDVQQGNYVTQDAVAKVKDGMTKSEVRQVLGTPLLSDEVSALCRYRGIEATISRELLVAACAADVVENGPREAPPVGTRPAPSLK